MTATPGATSSFPEEFNILPEFKKDDCFAIYNPKVKRVLDVILVHERGVSVCALSSEWN